MKLSRISRIVKILTSLQSGQRYSVKELTELVGVSRRTIFRDLNELSAIGVPFYHDRRTGSYQLDPGFFLPSIDLNLQEALSLLTLIHNGSSHLPGQFRKSAIMGGFKIENNLPREIRRYCNATLNDISIRHVSHSPPDLSDKVFWSLQRSVRMKRKVKFLYDSVYEGCEIETEIDPYHLTFKSRGWYVVGFSSMHNELRTFKLNRIIKLTIMEKCFIPTEKFDIAEYFGRSWSMIPEGKICHVKLKFSRKVAKNVSEVHWHTSQKSHFNPDGTVTMEFRVDGLGEIGWWILGYGDQVEVLAPAELRKHIAKTAGQMVKNHSRKLKETS